MTNLSTMDIAEALGVSRQAVAKRATDEGWGCKGSGRDLRWVTRGLPRDVIAALAANNALDATVPTIPGESLILSETSFLQARDKDRQVAQDKAAVVGLYRHSSQAMCVSDFVELYNAGGISPVLLRRLGHISVPTFYRWLKAWEDGGRSPVGLVPQYSARSKSRGAGESMGDLARSYLEFFWLRDSRPSMRSAWLELSMAMPDEAPSYQTAARYLKSLPVILVDYKRRGRCKMETLDLPYIERNMALYKAMDQLVSDHHCFDFLVEREGVLFRPWITAVQDFRSSKIVGFCPSVYPSSLSISVAFYLAVKRFGSCNLIHIDNGKDYRSQVLNGKTRAMKTLNEEGFLEEELVHLQGAYSAFSEAVTFARPYHGSSKGRMERTFGTFAQLFSRRVVSYVGSNTVERPEDAALYWRALNKKAKRYDVYSWDEYVRALASFIDWWNSSWRGEGNGMDGRSPDEVFAAEAVPMRPVSDEMLALAFSRVEGRKVRRNGVHLDGVNYWADELLTCIGDDVVVRRLLGDPDAVLVSDAKGRALCTAHADWFLETGDMAADNRRVGEIRRKAFQLARDAEASREAPAAGLRNLIAMSQSRFPARQLEALPDRQALGIAAGGEADPLAPGGSSGAHFRLERQNALLDLLAQE